MLIRRAQVKDIPKIVAMDKEAFGEGGISEEMVRSQLEVFPEGIFVACKDNKAVGVVCCERYETKMFPPYNHDVKKTHSPKGSMLYLSVITIAKKFRNQGIGSLLLNKISDFAKKLGIAKIYCPVNKKHPYLKMGVLHFWQKNDYQIVGETRWEVTPGKHLEAYIFEKVFKEKENYIPIPPPGMPDLTYT